VAIPLKVFMPVGMDLIKDNFLPQIFKDELIISALLMSVYKDIPCPSKYGSESNLLKSKS